MLHLLKDPKDLLDIEVEETLAFQKYLCQENDLEHKCEELTRVSNLVSEINFNTPDR